MPVHKTTTDINMWYSDEPIIPPDFDDTIYECPQCRHRVMLMPEHVSEAQKASDYKEMLAEFVAYMNQTFHEADQAFPGLATWELERRKRQVAELRLLIQAVRVRLGLDRDMYKKG